MIGIEEAVVAVGTAVSVFSTVMVAQSATIMLSVFGVEDGDGELVNLGRLTTGVPLGVSITLAACVPLATVSFEAGWHAERNSRQEAISHRAREGFMAKV
jgi:hypothetical protein